MGKRGPPKGSPKVPGCGRKPGTPNHATADVKALAGQYAPRVIEMLWQIANNPAAPEAARVAAGRELLDRHCGRPAQSIEAKVEQTERFVMALPSVADSEEAWLGQLTTTDMLEHTSN